jgi:sugar lactone lactonase YvrE
MSQKNARYTATRPINLAPGWNLERLTPPSRLFGSNGLRTGPDGRIYVAQVVGSQISALDVETGQLETISAKGGAITAPDDVAFDPRGNLYATEYYDGRVSVRDADGTTRVLRDDLPGANGITFHQGRLFINECRIGGRLMELSLNGDAPRVLIEGLPLPNAMEVGPDGMLYYPLIGTNDIWRIHPDGGTAERVTGDLGAPVAVKFDAKGYIVSPQVASGQVLRIDPRNGERSTLAQLEPGLDNLTFVKSRLFVSNFTGQITEILNNGKTQALLPAGLQWPLDLTVGEDGKLYLADGTHFYEVGADGKPQLLGMMFSPGYPGFIRGVAAAGSGEFLVTTSLGQISRYRPRSNEHEVLAQDLDQLYGLAITPNGGVIAAELGAGRVVSVKNGQLEVLATGLSKPVGVACAGGSCFISESGAGRVAKLNGSGVEVVLDGLRQPQGIVERDGQLYIVDAGDKLLIAFDLKSKARSVIAADLPIGAPDGVTPKPLRGLMPFSGPQGPFASIAAGADGTLYVSGDAEGSVLAIRPAAKNR